MFKQVMKYTLFAVIWKRYRALIIATVALFAYFWLVGLIHQDYLAVMERKGESSTIGVSFTIKWVFLLLGQGLYLLYLALWKRRPRAEKKAAATAKQDTKALALRKQLINAGEDDEAPVFQNLRAKPKLRSKSDLIIEKYPPKS